VFTSEFVIITLEINMFIKLDMSYIFSSLKSSGKHHNRRVSFGPVHEYHPKTYEESEEESVCVYTGALNCNDPL